MRVQPNWLNENDNLILELLGKSGVALNKRGIEINLELNNRSISYSTIKRRVNRLTEAGFLEKVREEGSYYRITTKGISYLTGSPYGAATGGNEPVEATEIEPLDYEILEEIHRSDEPLSEDDVIASITANAERVQDRIQSLISDNVLEETADNRFRPSLGGKYLLQMFRLSDSEDRDIERYGYVDLETDQGTAKTE